MLTAQLIDENEDVCDRAMECVLQLKQFKEKLNLTKVYAAEEKEKVEMNQIVELQKQMNEIVFNQMKQQHEFIEKQELKKKRARYCSEIAKIRKSRIFW